MDREPKRSNDEALEWFSHGQNAWEYVVSRRWPGGVKCPECGNAEVRYFEKQQRWQCGTKHRRQQFTARTGTIFEDSRLPLSTWLSAIWMRANQTPPASTYGLAQELKVTQKTTWAMSRRIRVALGRDKSRVGLEAGGKKDQASFDVLMDRILQVSKEEMDRLEANLRRRRKRKRIEAWRKRRAAVKNAG